MTRPTGSTRRARRLSAGVLALALGLLSACGGNDDNGNAASSPATGAASSASSAATETSAPSGTAGDTQGGGTIEVTARDFSFNLPSDRLSAGDYTIELTNDGSATHDLRVEKDGKDIGGTDTIGPGDTATATVTLEPGQYVFYCSVGNHRAMGMEVTVTVT